MCDSDQLLSSGGPLFRFGIHNLGRHRSAVSRKTAAPGLIDSQSIRFLLIEKGSYSNPASFFFFSRCSRRFLNGSGCDKSAWLDAPLAYCWRLERRDTGSLAAAPEPGDVDAKLRVRRIDPILSRSLPDLFELHSRSQAGFNLSPGPSHLPYLGSGLGRSKGTQVNQVRS